MRLTRFSYTLFTILIHLVSLQKRAQHTDARSIKRTDWSGRQRTNFHKNSGGTRMTYHVSRRSLLALGAGLGATAMMGGSALARAPKVGTQSPYFHRFNLGDAAVT